MATIRLAEDVWTKVQAHLFSIAGEHFAFMLAEHCQSPEGPVFLIKEAICVQDAHVKIGRDGWTVRPEGFLPAINAAVRSGSALIEAHNHGGPQPRFSRIDREGLDSFCSYALDSLPGRPYAATVWGNSAVYGEFFSLNGNTSPFRSIMVGGFRQIVSRDDDPEPVDRAFDRQLPWFTEDGQRRLGRIRVGVVGAGGTGSHACQLLAYLGIRDFAIIDDDAADDTSMNRLVTAAAADLGTPKAILARRLIKSVAPSARVTAMISQIQSIDAIGVLKEVDVLFGCVDNDGARLILNEISRAYLIPYFDLAAGIDVQEETVTAAGARLVVVTPGGPCLHCLNELDVDEARFFLSDAKERAFMIEHGYVSGTNIKAPSVVALNSAVAAAAVCEFATLVSGLRPTNIFTDIDLLGKAYEIKGQRAAPRRVPTVPDPGCVACITSGLGDRAAVERYARS